jgi:hypothetical protein
MVRDGAPTLARKIGIEGTVPLRTLRTAAHDAPRRELPWIDSLFPRI